MIELLNKELIFGLFGGLGLFLFGMKIMSEGLQKIAGDRMRKILEALTNHRLIGCLVGLLVTVIIQSSSATTVMVVGFVNAGLMNLAQSIGVVLGANIGTTITGQLIAFNITKYALPAIALGAGFKLFGRKNKQVYIGEILLGFGMLFYGMILMKTAFGPLKGSDEFREMFHLVGDYKLLGILIGAVLTMIVQSSSATMAITMSLAATGALSFEASVALILGENIGTTITANLAAIGTNTAARRAAFAHFLFNALGVCYMLLLFNVFLGFVDMFSAGDPDMIIQTQAQAAEFGMNVGDKPFIMRHIANAHTAFNIVNTLIFLPLVGVLARLATSIIPGKEPAQEIYHLKYLDNRVLNTPPIAMGQARAEIKRMIEQTETMLDGAIRYIDTGNESLKAELEEQEDLIDMLQKEITDFLVNLSQKSITQETSVEINSMIHLVNDLERIADHCENLMHRAYKKRDKKIKFSESAYRDLQRLAEKTQAFLHFVAQGYQEGDTDILEQSWEREHEINKIEKELRKVHIQRLNTGECEVQHGLIYIDMLHNLEKVADHTINVAEAVVGEK